MSVSTIVKGALAGFAAALLLAIGLGWGRYWLGELAGPIYWAANVGCAAAAGVVAGRGAARAGWLHGLLAAVSWVVVGALLGDAGGRPGGPLWASLALAAVVGTVGGGVAMAGRA